MADKKISQLNTATTVFDADDFTIVQDGETKQANASTVKAYAKDGLSKSDVGLGNVDNTSDATKNSATVTLTNKTLTSPTINGGTANNVAIGGTTPAAGNFTSLGATGNTTLGDAAGDTLTINGTAVSTPNNLNFDSNTLFIDAANNRVGIGTNNPTQLLDIRTSAGTAAQLNLYSGSSATATTLQLGQTGSVAWDTGITVTNGFYSIGVNGGGNAYTISRSGTAIGYHAFSTGGSERVRFDISGNVGIGTSTSSGKLTVSGVSSQNVASFLSSASGTFSTISIGRTANEFSLGTVASANQFFSGTAAGDSVIAYGTGKLFIGGGNTGSSGTLSTVFDVSGNVGIGVTPNNTYTACLQLSSGITFPATQVASANANTLDDYEEGTWTPTLTGFTFVGADQSSYAYVKVGRLVTVSVLLAGATSVAFAGAATITLPFTQSYISAGVATSAYSASSFAFAVYNNTIRFSVSGSALLNYMLSFSYIASA